MSRYRGRGWGTEEEKPKAPVMNRSRIQAATAYAPGVLFTFEGGRGICRSVAINNPKSISPSRATMIYDGITEYVETWLERAQSLIDANVPADLCIDQCFIKPGTGREVQVDRVLEFEITEPSMMGYEPFPLLFQCQGCGRLFESASIEDLASKGLPDPCRGCGQCSWRQVDVVFAHWSGDVEALSPSRNWWSEKKGSVERIDGCRCGGTDFILSNRSPVFSDWFFRCVGCGETREVVQASPFAASRLMPLSGKTGAWRETIRLDVNMLPVSYRASSLHYVQCGRFMAIDDAAGSSWLELFSAGRESDLLREVASLHRFPMREPTPEEIRNALREKGRQSEWAQIEGIVKAIALLKEQPLMDASIRTLELALKNQLDGLARDGSIPGPVVDNRRLEHQLQAQKSWARKRNPFRLSVEHRAFFREHIDGKLEDKRTVDVLSPDRRLFQLASDRGALAEYRSAVSGLLGKTGIDAMFLIRSLPVIEYSFGFSRVSALPAYDRPQGSGTRAMPVRLCAFPRMYSGKRPIYVLEQNNEALYVRLREGTVGRWLEANGIPTDSAQTGRTLGAAYIEEYEDFGEFMDAYKVRTDGTTPRGIANYVYMLLHSLAHVVIHAMADLSGLDADGIGEQIYPADLAFVVYRKGMTPDLGNVSSLWRNRHRQFLERILSPRGLRCGSGSLCDHRGGACPACIMTPDVTCIAHNHLLSRAALAGGRSPLWERPGSPTIVGFLATCARPLE